MSHSEIIGLDHASVIVKDTHSALGFYRDVLGLQVDASRPDLGYPGAWLNAGQQQIHLLEVPNPDPIEGRPAHHGRDRHVALAVADLGSVLARLTAAGIDFAHSTSGRRAAFCRDRDGNTIELVEA